MFRTLVNVVPLNPLCCLLNPVWWHWHYCRKYVNQPIAVYLISFDDTGTTLENMVPLNLSLFNCTVPTSVTVRTAIYPPSQGNDTSLKCQLQPQNDLYIRCNNFKVFLAIRFINLQQSCAINLQFKYAIN